MIEYLKHSEIDREMWDGCIKASRCLKPYPYSWYLDIMSPGWEALVEDEYESVFPVPCRSRFGISYIATPVFLQQLGAYSPDKPVEKVINEFLEYIPDIYKLVDLCVGQKVNIGGFRISERSNFVLDLSKSYEELVENFSPDCRRIINLTSKRKFDLDVAVSPVEIISLFKENQGSRIKGIRERDYLRLNDLMDFCVRNNKGKITGLRGKGKKLIYAVFQIRIHGYILLHFIAGTPESRMEKISHYLINEIIRINASTNYILDFAGSSIPSIAHFIESFGCTNVPYYRIYRNNLMWPVNLFK
jgi:hypothetical protein